MSVVHGLWPSPLLTPYPLLLLPPLFHFFKFVGILDVLVEEDPFGAGGFQSVIDALGDVQVFIHHTRQEAYAQGLRIGVIGKIPNDGGWHGVLYFSDNYCPGILVRVGEARIQETEYRIQETEYRIKNQ